MSEPQPSEAQETANAAYVWRKQVQAELVSAMSDPCVKLETAQWWFERFTSAYRREIEAECLAKAERTVKHQP